MGSENLNQRDLECGDFTVHENTCKVQLNLEAYVDVGSVDCGRPPKGKSSVGNLI